jgi:hypothetical protein
MGNHKNMAPHVNCQYLDTQRNAGGVSHLPATAIWAAELHAFQIRRFQQRKQHYKWLADAIFITV